MRSVRKYSGLMRFRWTSMVLPSCSTRAFEVMPPSGGTVARLVDAESGRPVADKDQVNGYEAGDGEFLLVEEDEIEAVQIESSHTLALETFVEAGEIEEVYLDTPYYLAPADKVSQEAFAVIRQAMAARKMAGLARIVLLRRSGPR